jgi:hypothetical protein|nr:MAG TPA: hypothetical protein [Caudoviricetes sp.]
MQNRYFIKNKNVLKSVKKPLKFILTKMAHIKLYQKYKKQK